MSDIKLNTQTQKPHTCNREKSIFIASRKESQVILSVCLRQSKQEGAILVIAETSTDKHYYEKGDSELPA